MRISNKRLHEFDIYAEGHICFRFLGSYSDEQFCTYICLYARVCVYACNNFAALWLRIDAVQALMFYLCVCIFFAFITTVCVMCAVFCFSTANTVTCAKCVIQSASPVSMCPCFKF